MTSRTYMPDSVSGWTPELCREQMAQCRRYAREYRDFPEATCWTYRFLNSQFYRQARSRLGFLLSAPMQNPERLLQPACRAFGAAASSDTAGECVGADSLSSAPVYNSE